ncbi:MAG: hypothetical protein IPO18_01495 [bacterium]|nr:hypothetical protein [bacterium]
MKNAMILILIPLALGATMAAPAAATEIDALGVYFDSQVYQNALCGVEANVQIPVYIILVDAAAPVKGLEFSYSIANATATVLRLVTTTALPRYTVEDNDPLDGSYHLMAETPLPASSAMVLVQWTLMFTAFDEHGVYYLRGVDDPSLPGDYPVVDGGSGYGLRRVGVSSGHLDAPVAFNGCSPLAVDVTSFGGVKNLFR